MNNWIDIPVVRAIEYFSSVLAQAFSWANKYAILFGIIGLTWSCIKLLFSRMTIKDLWWDTIFKWTGFILIMAIYPQITFGFSKIGNEIGLKVGSGKAAIEEGLTNLRHKLKQDLKAQKSWAKGLEDELSSSFEDFEITTEFGNTSSYKEFLNKVETDISNFKFDSGSDKKKAQNLLKKYRDKAKDKMLFSASTLSALESVIIEKNLDGTEGTDLTNSYVTLDIMMKDSDGNDSCYVSPSALLRVALLSCQIMFEKDNQFFAKTTNEIEENPDTGAIQKFGNKVSAYLSRIPQIVMVLFCCIVLILATIFACIQYVMTILEYTIVVGVGSIFLPLMLFDGTKDIPKKLIPVFTSFMVKMIVITICIMFVFYLMIESAINSISDMQGMNWITFADVFFNAILAYVLTQNAPKIAQTILTGQPQLSMGEAVAAAGTAAATVGGMGAAAANTARGIHKHGSDAVGGITKMASAGKQAASQVKDSGGGKLSQVGAALKGAGTAATADLKEKVKAKGESFARGHSSIPVLSKASQMLGIGGSAGGGNSSGGSGSSDSAHNITGQNRDGSTISTTSNASFTGAQKFDSGTNSMRNMTHQEYNQEKREQGTVIGHKVGTDWVNKQKEKEEKKKAQENGSSNTPLPDNITGGKREN